MSTSFFVIVCGNHTLFLNIKVDSKRFMERALPNPRSEINCSDDFEMGPIVTFSHSSSDVAIEEEHEEDDTLRTSQNIYSRADSASTVNTESSDAVSETILTRPTYRIRGSSTLFSQDQSYSSVRYNFKTVRGSVLLITTSLYRIFYPYFSVLSNRTAIPIAMYTLFALSNSLLHMTLPLLTSASLERGGYALGPQQTSIVMAGVATSKIIIKAVYLPVHGLLGTLLSYRIGAGLMIPSLILIPMRLGLTAAALTAAIAVSGSRGGARDVVSSLDSGAGSAITYSLGSTTSSALFAEATEAWLDSRHPRSSSSRHFSLTTSSAVSTNNSSSNNTYMPDSWPPSPVPLYPLVLLTSLTGIGEGLAYLAVVMVMTDSVESSKLGLVHGLGGCLSLVVRTVAPTVAGIIWELGGGTSVVFWLIIGIVVAEIATSFFVVRTTWGEDGHVLEGENVNDHGRKDGE